MWTMPVHTVEEAMVRAATMYYLQDQTMAVVAAKLGTSRSTVSRLLKRARAEGLVEIAVHLPGRSVTGLPGRLRTLFGVETYVVPLPRERGQGAELATLERVAMGVARLLPSWLESQMSVGVAWGTTMAAVARQAMAASATDISFVQLNGAGNTTSTGLSHAGEILSRLAAAYHGTMVEFPVPAFFDYAETKAAMWRERSVRRVLTAQAQVDMALFSVGAFGGELPSHVYAGGYLGVDELAALARDRVVGDVCTVFLRADGSDRGIELNARATGPSPAQLRAVHRRVCVVASRRKAPALLAALRAGLVTDLVMDQGTADALGQAMG
jgi:DNA-binding transcriptional regulator LsrR (DeoR family)